MSLFKEVLYWVDAFKTLLVHRFNCHPILARSIVVTWWIYFSFWAFIGIYILYEVTTNPRDFTLLQAILLLIGIGTLLTVVFWGLIFLIAFILKYILKG